MNKSCLQIQLGIINNSSMKFINVIVLIVLCSLNSLNAQDTIQNIKIQPKCIYATWISLNNEPFKINGVLYEIKDSSILVSSTIFFKDYSKGRMVNLHINNIETIKIRRIDRAGKGVLIGAITGFAVGGSIGIISGDDPPTQHLLRFSAGQKALMYGCPLAFGGAVIGGLIGSIKIKIPINGSVNNYNRNKNQLIEYSIKKK